MSEQRALAEAWYKHLREWRIIPRIIEPGRVPNGEIPQIRIVAGEYLTKQNGPVRELEPLVLTPIGAMPSGELVRRIRSLPLEARIILDRIRMAPKRGRESMPSRLRGLGRGYEIACLMLAEVVNELS